MRDIFFGGANAVNRATRGIDVEISAADFAPDSSVDFGSGLTSLDVYRGPDEFGGPDSRIGVNLDDFPRDHVYKSTPDVGLGILAKLPEGYVTFLLWDQAFNYAKATVIVDRTPPDVQVFDNDSRNVTGGVTYSSSVVVQAEDPVPGSGVHRFRMQGPGSYADVVFEGADAIAAGEVAEVVYDGLAEGDYAVTVWDILESSATANFTVIWPKPTIQVMDNALMIDGRTTLRGYPEYKGAVNTPQTPIWFHNDPVTPTGISFNSRDLEVGLKRVLLAKTDLSDQTSAIWDQPLTSEKYSFTLTRTELPDDIGYFIQATNMLDKETKVYFNVDSRWPTVPYELHIKPDFSVHAVGTAAQATSGIASVEPVNVGGPGINTAYFSGPPGPRVWPFDIDIPASVSAPVPFCPDYAPSYCESGLMLGSEKAWMGGIKATTVSGVDSLNNQINYYTGRFEYEIGAAGGGTSGWVTISSNVAGNFANNIRHVVVSPFNPNNCIENIDPEGLVDYYQLCHSGNNIPPECSLPCHSGTLHVRYTPPTTSTTTAGGVTIVSDIPAVTNKDIPIDFSGALVDIFGNLTLSDLDIPLGASFDVKVDIGNGPNPYFHAGYASVIFSGQTLVGNATMTPAPAIAVNPGDMLIGFNDPVTINLHNVAPGANFLSWPEVPVMPSAGLSYLPGSSHMGLNIATNASFQPPVQMTQTFDPVPLTADQRARVRLYHLESGLWRDVTTSVDLSGKVYGQADGLGVFALFLSSGVNGGDSLAAAALDSVGALWKVEYSSSAWRLSRDSASGSRMFSWSLPGVAVDGSWHIGFDASGDAYILNTSSGTQPATIVYRVTPRGALVSRVAHAGLDGKAAAVDSDGTSQWIAGVSNGSAALWKETASNLSLAAVSPNAAEATVWTDGNGSVYMAGESGEAALWRYDTGSGAMSRYVWANTLGGTGSSAQSLVKDTDGNVWLGGWARTASTTLAALWKWDGNNLALVAASTETVVDQALGLDLDPAGNFWLSGYTQTDQALWQYPASGGSVLSVMNRYPVFTPSLPANVGRGLAIYNGNLRLIGVQSDGSYGAWTRPLGLGTLSGILSYAPGFAGSNVYFALASSRTFSDAQFLGPLVAPGFGTVFDYALPDLSASATYYVAAIYDLSGTFGANQMPGPNDPLAVSLAPVFVPAGGSSASFQLDLAVDHTAPAVAIVSPVDGSNIPASLFSLSGTATDAVMVASVRWALKNVTDGLWWNLSGNAFTPASGPLWSDEEASGPVNSVSWAISANPIIPALLPGKSYALYVQASDISGNTGVATAVVVVKSTVGVHALPAGGRDIGKDVLDQLWNVVADGASVSLSRSDVAGVFRSSAILPGADTNSRWSVVFDAAGGAYAVGQTLGGGVSGFDLAVYKATPAGDAVAASLTFDSGYSNNDLVYEAVSPGWVVGAVQTEGPVADQYPGSRSYSMALWKFDPAQGLIQLTTTYSRTGFDVGTSVAVDGTNVWVAGFSQSPAPRSPHDFDLILWKYASDGHTLLGGPFIQEAFLSGIDNTTTANIRVSSGVVYVASPRARGAGGTDIALARFDKATNKFVSLHAWRPADDSSAFPSAIMTNPGGYILVAGGVDANGTTAALWRYDPATGGLLSANVLDAGGARGAVFRGTDLWLSVDGSTAPYRVGAQTALVGAGSDRRPPRTTPTFAAPFLPGDPVYVAATTPLGFSVVDDKATGGDALGAGATQTFYAVDSAHYSLFSGSFTLVAEGTHTISFYSVDLEGNPEVIKSTRTAMDMTAPVATFFSTGTAFALSAQDPVVNGAASGVKGLFYLVDTAPDSCQSVQPSTAAPPGTCANYGYAGPFTLVPGTHTVFYQAQDNLGNGEQVVGSSFVVVAGDVLPPRTTAEFGVPSAGTEPVYLTSSTPVVLRSVDDLLQSGDGTGLGVAFQEVSLTSLSSGTSRSLHFTAAVSTFSASAEADGLYSLDFFAVDAAGNREAVRRAAVAVDGTPPLTALAPGSPSFAGSRLFVSTRTVLGFAVLDPVIDGAASGVARTLYAVDAASFSAFSGGFSLAGGTHAVAFQSDDRLGNMGVVRSALVAVDADAPSTEVSFLGAVAASSGTVPTEADAFLSSAASVVLTAAEQGSTETASGLALTRYRLDSGAFSVYGGTFSLAAEGLHVLEFQSLDRVDNAEALRSARVAVDTTPPTVELAAHGPSYPFDGRLFVASTSVLAVTAADPVSGDVASGVESVEFRVDAASGAPFTLFLSSFTLPAGPHLVELRGRDRVGNESATTAWNVFVDTVAPASTFVVGEPQADLGGGVLLIAPQTPLLIGSTDPAAGGSASGLRETFVSLDSGAFSLAGGTFTLADEGLHTIRFFSRDNVLNEEAVRSMVLAVDSAPPTALLLSPSPLAVGVDQAFGRGLIAVAATVADLHLSSYTLEFAAGAGAQGGFALIASGTAPVTRGLIAQWDASALAGFYTLRLGARDLLGTVSVSTATVFIGEPGAVLVIKNQEGHGDKSELLDKPEGVAVGADGFIFVANTGKDQVLKFAPQGSLAAVFDGATTFAADKHDDGKSESITFKKPTGIAVDEDSQVYVADRDNDRVVVLSSAGVVLRSLGRANPQGRFIPGKGAGEFNKPTGVAVSPTRIAVADRNNGRVQVFDRAFVFLFDVKLESAGRHEHDEDEDDEDGAPFAVAWGPDGLLYVTDEGNDRVLVFDAQGALLTSIGASGSALGQFKLPKGAVVSALSQLYVADRANKRVQKFDAFRNSVLAFGDALGFQQPTGLALDPAGSLYVTDRQTDRVLKLGLPAPTTVVTAPPAAEGKVKRGKLASRGGKLSRADRVTVDIPAGALAQELEISIEPEKHADAEEDARKQRAKEGKRLAVVSEGVEYGPEGTVFNAPVTITLVYDSKTLPAGTREEDIKVHYWNPAKSEWEAYPSVVDRDLRTVSAKTMHFSLYQVMAPGVGTAMIPLAADPSFGLKAAYAFPNPVRGQNFVTIRLQPGLADSIELRVYDLSGRKIHESSAFSARGAFDDGNANGAQFTYDHVWDVSGVGSGVYTYVVVAKKAGAADIRKTGKIGVIK